MGKHGNNPLGSWRSPGHHHLHGEPGCSPLLQPQSRAHSCFKPPQDHAGAQRSQDTHTEGAPCPREAVHPLQGQAIQGSRLKELQELPHLGELQKQRVHCSIWVQPVGEVCCLYTCRAGRQSCPEGICNFFALKGSAKPAAIRAPTLISPHSPQSGKQLSLGREKQCFPKPLFQNQKSGKFTIGLPYKSTPKVWG